MAAASTAFRFLLGFVLVSASIPKFAARADFAIAVQNYELVPPTFARAIARLLPAGELVCGLFLLSGTATSVMSFLVALMLVGFVIAVSVNLLRGRSIECGCTGASSPRRIGWSLVARDIALAAIALVVALGPSRSQLWQLPRLTTAASVSQREAIALALTGGAAAVVEVLALDLVRARRAMSAFKRARAKEASR